MSSIAVDIEKLAEDHLYLVEAVARRIHSSCRHLDKDDVLEAGCSGLWAAMKTYNPDKQTSFKTWAQTKIKWAILDFSRSEARHHRNTVALEDVKADNQHRGGRQQADDSEQPFTKPVFKLVPKDPTPSTVPMLAVCNCKHEFFFHHSGMGCMHWDRRRTGVGGGWCSCDDFSKNDS